MILTLSGTFDILTDMYIFVLWVFFGMTAVGLFVLRKKFPDAERPFRVIGYPVVPALFLLSTVYLVINTLIATPGRALGGVAMIVSGVPVYFLFSRKQEPLPWLGREGSAEDRTEV